MNPTSEQTREHFTRSLTNEVANTRRALRGIVTEAQDALEALENVQRPQTGVASSTLFGRRAVDADAHVARLTLLLDLAQAVGLQDEDVVKAFKDGFAAGRMV